LQNEGFNANKTTLTLSTMKKLIRYFIQGLIVFTPAGITIGLFIYVLHEIDSKVNALVEQVFNRSIPGLGILLLLSFITILGALSSTVIFGGLFKWIESLILKNSLLRMVYSSVKDLFDAFVGDKKKFNKPVLVAMERSGGIYRMGFITQEDLELLGHKQLIAVYLPHAYAFSGNLFMVEKELIQAVNISAAEAMKFIISGGITHIDKQEATPLPTAPLEPDND